MQFKIYFYFNTNFYRISSCYEGNQFKKDTIDLLERTVDKRTLELSEANQLITESIKSASKIQNAILPKIGQTNMALMNLNTFGNHAILLVVIFTGSIKK